MRLAPLVALVVSCSIPSPQAPSWEVTAHVPLVARAVFVRDLVDRDGDFFFGEYGPFRLIDSDSVAASVVSGRIVAESAVLQGLPVEGEGTITLGDAAWSGNPVDELENPTFYRAWLEIVVRHTLPGRMTLEAVVRGWDDDHRPCEPITVSLEVDPSSSGQEIVSTHLIASSQVLAFVNPSVTHAVPDSYAASATVTYTGVGQPIGPDPRLSIDVSLLTAFDLTFDGAQVNKRAVLQKLVIGPEGADTEGDDVDGDLTKHLRSATIVADVANNLPLGGQALVRVAHDSAGVWEAPELVVGPFAFHPPEMDPRTGKSLGVAHSRSVVSLSEDQLRLFANPGPQSDTLYAAVEYLLDGAGTHRICICADDSVAACVLMSITSLVEPDDGT